MNDQRADFEAWYDRYDMRTPQDPFDRALARKAWDAAMQSQEVQALRRLSKALEEKIESYERYGAICEFEGEPMIHAAHLEELRAAMEVMPS